MICGNCGAPTDGRDTKCRYCGHDLRDVDISKYIHEKLAELNAPYVDRGGPRADFLPVTRGKGRPVVG